MALSRALVRAGIAVLCLIGVLGCAGERTYRGTYFSNFENSMLALDGGDEALCVRSPDLEDRLVSPHESVRANVVVRGRLVRRNHSGGLGACRGVLLVTEVIEVTQVRRQPE
jgi:hypothetical protein